MGRKVYVVGVGMIKFEKPGKRDWDYPQMGKVAAKKALTDAGIPYEEVNQAVVGYVYGDSTCGQRALYEVGLTGIPIYNVNNNCSTGSTALYMAKQLIEGGISDCVIALGFEKMERGSLGTKYTDRTNPMDKHMGVMAEARGVTNAPFAPQMFGNAGREHMDRFGTTLDHFAKIAHKNHKHSVNNPYSQFREEYTLEDIKKSRKVFDPLTMLQCCPTSDGAAAAVLCSEEVVRRHNLQSQAVEIAGMSMATDLPSTFQEKSCIKMVGSDMTRKAATEAYRQAGLSGPEDVQVIELHDCFSCNELITYEGLGLCPEGRAGRLVDDGDVTYGGRWVVNPSGGLISKGHPLGATGLAQCCELCWQIRGMCGARQVPNVRAALQHNLGLGGAAVVTVYRHGFPEHQRPYPSDRPNPAIDENAFAEEQVAAGPSSPPSPASADVGPIFEELRRRVAEDASLVAKIGGSYLFVLSGGAGGAERAWLIDLKTGPAGRVEETSPSQRADCTVRMAEGDFVSLVAGQLDPQSAFMKGQLKISGNMGLAMKLGQLFNTKKKAAL